MTSHLLHVDASFLPVINRAAYCLIFRRYRAKNVIQHVAEISSDTSAHAEVNGIYHALQYLIQNELINKGDTIRLYCDCTTISHMLKNTNSSFRKKHLDLYSAFNELLSTLKITLEINHIKGHKKEKRVTMQQHVEYNHKCDTAARAYINTLVSDAEKMQMKKGHKFQVNYDSYHFKHGATNHTQNIQTILHWLHQFKDQEIKFCTLKGFLATLLQKYQVKIGQITHFSDYHTLILFFCYMEVIIYCKNTEIKFGNGTIISEKQLLMIK